MLNLTWLISIAVTFAVFLIYVTVSESQKLDMYDQLLEGHWVAPLAFCTKSGINSARMHFGPDCETMYILIEDSEGAIILNKCPRVTRSACHTRNIGDECVEYEIEFDEQVAPLPQQGQLRVNMRNGMMGIFADDVLYMEAFKDNQATAGVV